MSLDNDFIYYFHGDTLLQQREIELLDAELQLKRYIAMRNNAPNANKRAQYDCEVYRYTARIDGLKLSIQTLTAKKDKG